MNFLKELSYLLNNNEYVKHETDIFPDDINLNLLEENAFTKDYVNILSTGGYLQQITGTPKFTTKQIYISVSITKLDTY